MASDYFTVSFLSQVTSEWTHSRTFTTKRAAIKWARELRQHVAEVALHHCTKIEIGGEG
jgi:hypothetical protein